MEIKKIRSEKIGEPVHSNNKAVWLRKYKFWKVQVFRNKQGEVVQERPFTEFGYSLFVAGNDRSIWLNDNLLRDVKDVLADLEEEEFSSS